MKNIPHDLGVCVINNQVYLYSHALTRGSDLLHLGLSGDGINFRPSRKLPIITINKNLREDTRFCSDFRISQIQGKLALFYKLTLSNRSQLCLAFSKNGIQWEKKKQFSQLTHVSMIVPEFNHGKKFVMYTGEGDIYSAYSNDLLDWDIHRMPVLAPRAKYFDNYPLHLGSVINLKKAIAVIYYVKKFKREGNTYTIGLALFDKKNPGRLIYRSDTPVWEQAENWQGEHVYPMGGIYFNENLYLYFGLEGDAVYAVSLGNLKEILNSHRGRKDLTLEKHPRNPIISPVLKHVWESSATFNTAAIYENSKVHFVYRAMGPDNTSVLGYASSTDGVNIDERIPAPIYYPTQPFEVPVTYPTLNYMSGGGYGGCEDPRLTKIDETIYMTYVAYNGRDAPKVALTSIKVNDFLSKNWVWAKPKIISSPNHVNKNAVLFPEKINGKYVLMHRVFPDILIDFLDNLDFDDSHLTGHFKISPRAYSWDSRKLGAGAPPIKTKIGWLLIYQAVDDRDPGKYKIGAMILDLKNPAKVLYRPHKPILTPTEWYENQGFKSGVAYPCGAVIKDNRLFVYYGGADTVVCCATADLDELLKLIKTENADINIFKPLLNKIPPYKKPLAYNQATRNLPFFV